MFEIYRPKKDATIFGYNEQVNSGIDEILELNTRPSIRKNFGDEYNPSRILMDFPTIEGDFSSIIKSEENVFANFGFPLAERTQSSSSPDQATGTFNTKMEDAIDDSTFGMPNSFSFFGEKTAPSRPDQKKETKEEKESYESDAWLRLWFASGQGLPKKYKIEAYNVKSSWEEGRGRSNNDPFTKEPVNWIERTEKTNWENPGGDYFDIPKSSESFNGDDPDVWMNLSPILSEPSNHGILIKRQDEDFDRVSELKFFSSQSQTVYPPHVLVGKDSYELKKQNTDSIEHENFVAFISNMKEEYPPNKTRFKVTVREKYSQRDFLGVRPTNRTDSVKADSYLPNRSLTYKIEDVRTGHTIFPFDKRFSAVSFDGMEHYFDVNLKNLFPKRDYKILLKYTNPETKNQKIFDNNQKFKVTS